MRLVLIIVSLTLAPLAQAAVPVGSGDAVAIAGGTGVDLLVWRDGSSGAVRAMRVSASGAPLDGTPINLPVPAGGVPAAAWDGSGFVIAVSGSTTLLARLPVSGGMGFTVSFGPTAPIEWSAVASKGDGSSVVVWSAGSNVYSSTVFSDGQLVSATALPFEISAPAKLARESGSYLLGWIERCILSPCPPETPAFVQRLDDRGIPIGPAGGLTFAVGGSPIWSFAEGPRAILTVAPEALPAPTTLLAFDPGQYRAARRTIRFPEPLRAQSYRDGVSLIGLGARIDVSETGAPLTVNWAPLAEGERLAGVLPSSGMRVLVPASGAGTIAIEAPASDVSEVGLTPVHISASTVWLKVDNRGPDHARAIDVWVTAPVRSFSSLVAGTITRFGPLTRLRFQPNLIPGAGYEIALYFESPIDPNAFEAWALTLGTDRDATNNYVSTLPLEPEPEPEPPARRRLVTRP